MKMGVDKQPLFSHQPSISTLPLGRLLTAPSLSLTVLLMDNTIIAVFKHHFKCFLEV